jgi:hypothetical protein
MINTKKTCNQCNLEQSLDNFYKKKGGKYGVMSVCKLCFKNRVQEYQTTNKDIVSERRKQRYLDNKSEYSERNKTNYLKNQTVRKEKQKQYSALNKEKRKEYNQRPEIKKRDNEYSKAHYKATPEKHLAKNIRCSISMRIKEIDSKKDQKTLDIVGLNSWTEFKEYIEKQFTEGMSWNNYGNKIETDWSIDHIIPISSATTLDEVKKLNHYTNLRPLWHLENIKKRDKIKNK